MDLMTVIYDVGKYVATKLTACFCSKIFIQLKCLCLACGFIDFDCVYFHKEHTFFLIGRFEVLHKFTIFRDQGSHLSSYNKAEENKTSFWRKQTVVSCRN